MYTIGAGYLNIPAALRSIDVAAGSALSPTVIYNTDAGQALLVEDKQALWDDYDVEPASRVGFTGHRAAGRRLGVDRSLGQCSRLGQRRCLG